MFFVKYMEVLLIILVILLAALLLILFRAHAAAKIGAAEQPQEITEFLHGASIQQIEKELLGRLQKADACPRVIGKGGTATVTIPEQNPAGEIAVKRSTREDQRFGMKIIDGILYIGGYADLTTEAIILMLVGKLPGEHLPVLLDYATCDSNYVSKLVFPLYGLDEIEIDLTDRTFPETQFWKMAPRNKIKSRLSTLRELFVWMFYTGDGTHATLPNGHTLDIVKYYDRVCVDYLQTYAKLKAASIHPFDMHPGNIFLKWDGAGAPTIILGDVGAFMAQVRPDVVILGAAPIISEQAKYAKERMARNNAFEFIYKSFPLLTPAQAERSVARKIFLDPPYSEYPTREMYFGEPEIKYLDRLKTAEELLKYFAV